MIKLGFVCFVLFFGGLVIADNVPAVIWGPFNHYTPAIALKSYNGDEFINILSEHVTPETLTLVVAEDKLSNEDLSQCRIPNDKTCFQGIQQLKSKLYLSSVEDPVSIIEDMAGLDKIEVTLSINGQLSGPINQESGKYVFINFDDNNSDETKSSMLTRHDKLITKLYNDLSSQGLHLMIIYTGKRANIQKHMVKRQAPATAATNASSSSTTSATTSATTSTTRAAAPKPQPRQETPEGIFWKRDRLLIYYTKLESVSTAGTVTEIVIDRVELDEAAPRIVVRMFNGDVPLGLNITGEAGYWWVEEISYNGNPLNSNTRIAAVDHFSFHCSPVIELATASRDLIIRWEGLQIQPQLSTVAGQEFNAFGDAWDCVGFVSPGIVGGLFVVIMLLIILSIGISFMMDINTMDRFDDPKGKTITINVNE